jgi:renalase
MTHKVGIIGAGVAGLTLGCKLQEQGFTVEIFDKGRAVGGRTASRRTQWGELDYGAQFLTIRDRDFQAFLDTHLPPDWLVPWAVDFARLDHDQLSLAPLETVRYVPRQSMRTLCEHLAAHLAVSTQVKICQLKREQGWILQDDQGQEYGAFDQVVATAPPAQTAVLLSGHSEIAPVIDQISMWPCWTLMLTTFQAIALPFGGIQCDHPILGWIGLNHTKPERGAMTALIVQANWHWSAGQVETDPAAIGPILYEQVAQVLGIELTVEHQAVHLWRYATPLQAADQPYFRDPANHLAACGDWCVAGKIEGAFLSANALAKVLIGEA